MMANGHVQLTGVTKRFRVRRGADHVVLDGLDLEIERGQSLVLLGPSGTGKTTLLRIVAGLDTADAGTVRLGDRVLSDPDVRVAPEDRGIGMVFQALELWPHMTAAEHIAFGLPGRPRGRRALRDADVIRFAFDVGLTASHLSRRPDTLSGGERQRVAIARTLAAGPDVILYDEPLANLDPDRRVSLRALVRRLGEEHGTTTIYVTHDAEEALAIGDEIAVLGRGRILEQQAPALLYRNPHTLAGARALGAVTLRAAEIRDGRAVTALGTADLVDRERAETALSHGPVVALWRPEQIRPTDAQGAPCGRVQVCRPTGSSFTFTAAFDDGDVVGTSETPLASGEAIGLVLAGPVAVVRAPAAPREDAA